MDKLSKKKVSMKDFAKKIIKSEKVPLNFMNRRRKIRDIKVSKISK